MDLNIKSISIIGLLISMFAGIFLFDNVLADGLLMLSLLSGITVFIIWKLGFLRKELLLLLFVVLVVHVAAVLFIYYTDFQPFSGGGGDYITYQRQAEEIATRVSQGNFSTKGIGVGHFYPVILGYLYALTSPVMLIGQLFNIWISVIAILLLYFIVLEIGVSRKGAFLVGIIAGFYPSYLFFTSLLLKDVLVIALALAGMLVLLKTLRHFSWKYFSIFFLILVALIHFRFYIGFVLIITFIISWFLFVNISIRKRFLYALIILPLLGIAPQITGHGYYGIEVIRDFATPEKVHFYKEVVYSPNTQGGVDSSVDLKINLDTPTSFSKSFSKSLFYTILGPIPGQLKETKHLFTLFEMIPWYLLLFFIGRGILHSFQHNRIALPLFIFAIGIFSVLAIFMSNFGIITRIRIPAFLVLLSFIPLYFQAKEKKNILNDMSDSYSKKTNT